MSAAESGAPGASGSVLRRTAGSERGPALLLAVSILLPLAVAILLATARVRGSEGEEFQRLVGGLGLGAAVDLSGCGPVFDPRDGWSCSYRHDPLPCASAFCPAHAAE